MVAPQRLLKRNDLNDHDLNILKLFVDTFRTKMGEMFLFACNFLLFNRVETITWILERAFFGERLGRKNLIGTKRVKTERCPDIRYETDVLLKDVFKVVVWHHFAPTFHLPSGSCLYCIYCTFDASHHAHKSSAGLLMRNPKKLQRCELYTHFVLSIFCAFILLNENTWQKHAKT